MHGPIKICNSKACYIVAQGCNKVKSSKYGKLRYETIGETQPEWDC